MKYRFIKNHELQFPIEKMCFILKINSSSYYKWKKRGDSIRFFSILKFSTTEIEDIRLYLNYKTIFEFNNNLQFLKHVT